MLTLEDRLLGWCATQNPQIVLLSELDVETVRRWIHSHFRKPPWAFLELIFSDSYEPAKMSKRFIRTMTGSNQEMATRLRSLKVEAMSFGAVAA